MSGFITETQRLKMVGKARAKIARLKEALTIAEHELAWWDQPELKLENKK